MCGGKLKIRLQKFLFLFIFVQKRTTVKGLYCNKKEILIPQIQRMNITSRVKTIIGRYKTRNQQFYVFKTQPAQGTKKDQQRQQLRFKKNVE